MMNVTLINFVCVSLLKIHSHLCGIVAAGTLFVRSWCVSTVH